MSLSYHILCLLATQLARPNWLRVNTTRNASSTRCVALIAHAPPFDDQPFRINNHPFGWLPGKRTDERIRPVPK
jgi:hypothetical protein